jgi:hypothetical protein
VRFETDDPRRGHCAQNLCASCVFATYRLSGNEADASWWQPIVAALLTIQMLAFLPSDLPVVRRVCVVRSSAVERLFRRTDLKGQSASIDRRAVQWWWVGRWWVCVAEEEEERMLAIRA